VGRFLYAQKDMKQLYHESHYAFREGVFEHIGLFLDRLLELVKKSDMIKRATS
jgi:hypothetical protein